MPIRDTVLALVLMGILPLILYRPHVGVLAWAWVAFMNPHREVYSFLQGTQLNLVIAILTIVGLLVARERIVPRLSPVLVLMFLLIVVWGSLTTFTSLSFDHSYAIWDRNIKTFLLALFVAILIDRPSRIHAMILIIVISLGYWGTIATLQTLASLGTAPIRGPGGTMIADANHLALAMIMVLPLIEYCRHVSENRWVRLACIGGMFTTTIGILGTYSRGGFIALVVLMLLYLWRSHHRMFASVVVAVGVVVAAFVLPAQWSERMATIETAQEEDQSFQARLNAWRTSVNVALDRPFVGGGYRATEIGSIYVRYKDPDDPRMKGLAVHSAYFQVLADHGFIGLALFGLMFLLAILNCRWVRRKCAPVARLRWLAYLASMLEISFLAYAVGAAALSMAYYDAFIVLVVVSGLLKHYAQGEIKVTDPTDFRPQTARSVSTSEGLLSLRS